jgi:hypothetical protein
MECVRNGAIKLRFRKPPSNFAAPACAKCGEETTSY